MRVWIGWSLALLALCVVPAYGADIVTRSWVFSTPGNMQGWTANKYTDKGVDGGYFYGTTTAYDSSLVGPDLGTTVPANTRHYLQFRMRMRFASAPTDRFGASDAYLYWTTAADPLYSEDKKVSFKTFGNGAWKIYTVRLGSTTTWTGTIKLLKLYLTSKIAARTEVEWIKVIQDGTGPEFSAKHLWTYQDGDSTCDTTPTLHLRQPHDLVSGIDRAEFYQRPGASTSESDWVLDGTDSDGTDGYQYTYPAFADGVYDLGVKLYDKAGNCSDWTNGSDHWINDLHINSTLIARIDVDAGIDLGAVPKEIPGNNAIWGQWWNKYNPATNRLTDNLENSIQTMGVPVMRYPGGCFSDTFYWKLSIGAVASRPHQYYNGCNTTLSDVGPARFGLDEFLRWCEARGVQPMFTCRFRWPGAPPAQGTVNGVPVVLDGADPYAEALADAIDLVEYCNSPNDGSNPNGGTDWAAVRAANGHPAPYNLKLFEIGNEPWGPDPWGSPGNIGLDGASEYSVAFLNYLEGMKAIDPTIQVSATSLVQSQMDFDPANPSWPYSMYEQTGGYIDHAQIHPYFPYSGWQTDMVKLYDETMAASKAIDDAIAAQRTAIKLTTPEKDGLIKLRATEWNINYNWWYDPAQGRINTYHTKTLKAAIATADAFRVFMENRDVVESAEWWHLYADTWGCIASDDVTRNPAFHAFRIFNRHFGDSIVQSKVTGSPIFDYVWSSGSVLKSQYGLAYLTAIASKSATGDAVYLVVINKDRTTPHNAAINVAGFLPSPCDRLQAEIWELNGLDVDDYTNVNNTTITESSTSLLNGSTYTFPAHSVTSFKFTYLDTAPPVITCSDQAVPAGDGCMGICPSVATATDDCGATITQSPAVGTPLPVGDTVVTATATDRSGQTASCTTTVTVELAPTTVSFNLGTGCWHLFSLPCDPLNPDPAAVFPLGTPLDGNLTRYGDGGYVAYYGFSPADFGPMQGGAGYWIYASDPIAVSYSGCCPTAAVTMTYPTAGWYLTGSHQLTDVSLLDCSVRNNTTGESKSFSEAWFPTGWVMDPLYPYSCTTKGYLTTGVDFTDSDSLLHPHQGYWFYTIQPNLSLIAPGP